MSHTVDGKCLCGAIGFTAKGPFEKTSSCHCSQCARWTGGRYASTTVTRTQLQLRGEALLKWYLSSDHARRGFCSNCGSSLFWENPGSGKIDIMLGTLMPPVNLEIDYHIFVGDKSDYYQILDGKPQFVEYTDGPQIKNSKD